MIGPTLRNAPIGRRLMISGLLTTGIVLLAVSVVMILRGVVEWRSRTVSDLVTYAAMIGANAAPAVMFEDAGEAATVLAALSAKPSIVYAAIYVKGDRLLATYRAGDETGPAPAPPAAGHFRFSLGSASTTQTIVFKGDRLGTIHLQADLREMYRSLARDTGLIVLAALAAFWVGTRVFTRLQRAIVEPIRNLAETMHSISKEQDYASRVAVVSSDEVGMLSTAFNEMLARIESRDAQLARHSAGLEGEVLRRTAQLSEINGLLEQQLAERRRAEAELQAYTGQIELLSQMGGVLRTCLAAEEIYAAVGQFMTRLFPHWSGTLFVLNNSRVLLESVASWGALPHPHAVFAPNDCWAMRGGQIHISEKALTAPRCSHAGTAVEASLCVPLTAQAEMLGILCLQLASGASSAAEQRLFSRIAGEIAQALANLTLRDALKRLAIRDPLTGMFNRRYLEEYLALEISRARRSNTPLSLVMIDLDYFKRFNDTFGHDAGDSALRALGEFFLRHVRDGDVACRYGGEEFILALWDAPLQTACERAESMRVEAKSIALRAGGRSLGAISISVGVAAFPDHGESGSDLIKAADRALYRAKAEGRDRVCQAISA